MSNEAEHKIFALDIGTRSVVGIVLEKKKDEKFQLVDYVKVEHKERSMVDGQIHDVLAVAHVIKEVKLELEKRHGQLKKVAVAAAGRSLRTKRAVISKEIAGRPLLTRSDILALELEAVQVAQANIAEELADQKHSNVYCVGFSVIQYKLDDEPIGNLIDQRGKTVSVEIIATFLPRVVVDSLISSLKRADLEMKALTLEPIAAINVLVPTTMRRLNIALVDIGAGTSDIAITSEGAITAYGMVPCAGDEITEALSQQYILDFPQAELIKRKLYCEETIAFDDFLGFQHVMESKKMIEEITPAIQSLAEQIAKEIVRLNGRSPQAVMMIGGGSLTPTLNRWVAEFLGLPENRVGIRGIQQHEQIDFHVNMEYKSPDAVTPIGIAIAAEKHPVKYLSATVNGHTVRLFDLRKLTVGDAILSSGLNIKKFYGKPGLALSIEVNGKLIHLPGTHGQPPLITCNGSNVDLDHPLKENDQIEIVQGADGENARATVKELISDVTTLDVYVNDKRYSIPPLITVNGNESGMEHPLNDRDRVTIRLPMHVSDVLNYIDFNHLSVKPSFIHYYVNGEQKSVEITETELYVNGQPATLKTTVYQGAKIEIRRSEQDARKLRALMPEHVKQVEYVLVTFNDEQVKIEQSPYSITRNGKPVNWDDVIHDGDRIEWQKKEKQELIFQDVFRYVDIEPVTTEERKAFYDFC